MNTALWFSGGKDSMACLLLHEHELETIDVIWANTGRYFPEAIAFVEAAKERCPRWHEVKTDREAQWKANGLPSDIVAIDHTAMGQLVSRKKPVMVQSYLGCCWENISLPLLVKTKELGATRVIRGQRTEEAHRVPAGVHADIEFVHPIEDWTAEQVLSYLHEKLGELPDHFALEHSSMDCFDCTAFAAHSLDRAKYMRERHPALYSEYRSRIRELTASFSAPLRAYKAIEAIND